MKTPESYLKTIAKLRARHTQNVQSGNWDANHGLRAKIITAWEGYHVAINRLLNKAGCAVGNEHRRYSQAERIKYLVNSRDYSMRQPNTREH